MSLYTYIRIYQCISQLYRYKYVIIFNKKSCYESYNVDKKEIVMFTVLVYLQAVTDQSSVHDLKCLKQGNHASPPPPIPIIISSWKFFYGPRKNQFRPYLFYFLQQCSMKTLLMTWDKRNHEHIVTSLPV